MSVAEYYSRLNQENLWSLVEHIDFPINSLPTIDACVLYQIGDLGSPLNDALRQGKLTQTLDDMYQDFMSAFSLMQPLGKELIVFRGIPKEDIPKINVGDIISDPAFNSVTLHPPTARYFGDVIFIMSLRSEDKLIPLQDKKYFFPDVYECILPPHMQYLVVASDEINYGDELLQVYILQSEGWQPKLYSIDLGFDVIYHKISSLICHELQKNEGKQSNLEREAVLIMYKDKITYDYYTLLESLHPSLNLSLFSLEKAKSPIFQTLDLYILMVKAKVDAIYLLPWIEAKDGNISTGKCFLKF